MITIPVKAKERLVSGVKRFQPVLAKARDKDINESDTVTIIVDLLSDVFGYDKYTEVTSEYAVKKTYCDLAVKIDGTPRLLIEVKATGLSLKDQFIRQAVDYGSNSGIDWVILTNSIEWKVYKIVFSKPIDMELVYEFNLTQINTKRQSDIELLYYLSREAMLKPAKTSLDEYHLQKQIINRFTIGQTLLSEPVMDAIRKQLRKISAETKVSNEEISQILTDEIIKREVLDGEKATEAKKKIAKAIKAQAKPAKATAVKSTIIETEPDDTKTVAPLVT